MTAEVTKKNIEGREQLNPLLLNVQDLQVLLKVGRDKAYGLMHSKSFPAVKIGGRYYVAQDELRKWLERYTYKKFVI